MKRLTLRGLCALAALMLPHFDVAAAELVVIGSTGPGLFSTGDIVDGKKIIRVPGGESVTLMDKDGKVITVRGPYAGAIGGPEGPDDMSVIKLVSALFNEHPTQPLGAFRGAPGTDLTDPWVIDVSTPSDKCIRAKDAAMLWQPGFGKANDLTLAHVAAGRSVKVTWPAGASTVRWPQEIPLEQGARYEAKLKHQIEPNRFVLHIADESLSEGSGLIAWMVRAGCYPQAQMLLGTLPADKIIDPSGGKG